MTPSSAYLKSIEAIVLAWALGCGWPSSLLADEPTSSQASSDQTVQERAVPPEPVGVIVQGNQLRAMSGYVLGKGQNNQMIARPRAGTGQVKTLNCGCRGGSGDCSMGWSDDTAVCFSSENKPCQSKCEWYLGPPSKVGPPSMR